MAEQGQALERVQSLPLSVIWRLSVAAGSVERPPMVSAALAEVSLSLKEQALQRLLP